VQVWNKQLSFVEKGFLGLPELVPAWKDGFPGLFEDKSNQNRFLFHMFQQAMTIKPKGRSGKEIKIQS
jgi:hypothetical protein